VKKHEGAGGGNSIPRGEFFFRDRQPRGNWGRALWSVFLLESPAATPRENSGKGKFSLDGTRAVVVVATFFSPPGGHNTVRLRKQKPPRPAGAVFSRYSTGGKEITDDHCCLLVKVGSRRGSQQGKTSARGQLHAEISREGGLKSHLD